MAFLFFLPPLLATIPIARWIFLSVGHPPHLADLEATYYQITMLGAGGMLFSAVQAGFFTGVGDTRRVMLVDTAAAILNLVLDYLWIFGKLGFPAGGLAGAAWACTAAQWFKVVCYGAVMTSSQYAEYRFADGRYLEWPLLRRLWYFGTPNGWQWFLEGAGFTGFLLFVGRLGEEATAATNLAFNINSLGFIPLLGLSIAVTILVGRELGANRPSRAERATWTAFQLAAIYTGVLAIAYAAVPDLFLVAYSAGAAAENFAAIRPTVVILLRFVAAYCLFDAMNLTFSGALRGVGDTRFILRVGVIMCPIPAAITWLGIEFFGAGLIFSWLVLTLWTCALGGIYLFRFIQERWKEMRVIEPAVIEEAEPGGLLVPAQPEVVETLSALAGPLD